jgi:hypothetical protein
MILGSFTGMAFVASKEWNWNYFLNGRMLVGYNAWRLC